MRSLWARGGYQRIVEKVGAYDPVPGGFLTRNEVIATVVRNDDQTGFVGWSVASTSPGSGYYYQPPSEAQKRRALARAGR